MVRRLGTAALVWLLSGCGGGEQRSDDVPPPVAVTDTVRPAPVPAPPLWGYIEKGDLAAIRARGRLRATGQFRPEDHHLPRVVATYPRERELVRALAADLGVELVVVRAATEADVVRYLHDGKGDIALGKRTVDNEQPPDTGRPETPERANAFGVVVGATTKIHFRDGAEATALTAGLEYVRTLARAGRRLSIGAVGEFVFFERLEFVLVEEVYYRATPAWIVLAGVGVDFGAEIEGGARLAHLLLRAGLSYELGIPHGFVMTPRIVVDLLRSEQAVTYALGIDRRF